MAIPDRICLWDSCPVCGVPEKGHTKHGRPDPGHGVCGTRWDTNTGAVTSFGMECLVGTIHTLQTEVAQLREEV